MKKLNRCSKVSSFFRITVSDRLNLTNYKYKLFLGMYFKDGARGLVTKSRRSFSHSTNHEEDILFSRFFKHSRQHDNCVLKESENDSNEAESKCFVV